jgi:hypothetical protein
MYAFSTQDMLSIPDLDAVDNILKNRDLSFQFKHDRINLGSNQQFAEDIIFNSAYAHNTDTVKIRQPKQKLPEIRSYKVEQEYEAEVIAINQDESTFTARLVDLTNNGPDEEGEFSLSELNGDESLVIPGALFTWTIGLQTRGSRDLRVSDIRFRRIPPFSKEVIAKAEQKAQLLSEFFDENTSTEPFELHL